VASAEKGLSRLEKIWEGQRNHHYHWLLLRIGHFKALMGHLPLIVICAVVAIMGRTFSEGEQVFASLLFFLFFFSALFIAELSTICAHILNCDKVLQAFLQTIQ